MESTLPIIPPKRYFTIGEVSELCGVKPHVLRYWEQEFAQLRPMKRRGNRRYYQRHEVLLVRRIRDLLYEQGFTISGARNRLAELGPSALLALEDELDDIEPAEVPVDDEAVLRVGGLSPPVAPVPPRPLFGAGAAAVRPVTPPPVASQVPTPPIAREVLVRNGARSLRDELLAIRALLADDPEGA
jgi:DNA-binding transcriptional MerR regulator